MWKEAQPVTFPALTAVLKAAAEATRLRILALLAETELTVSDLTEILRQSQPRLSRHLRLLAEASLVERFREGAWAFFRLGERGSSADIARTLIARLDVEDPVIARDRERLAAVRSARAAAAQAYFRRHAAEWDRIRKLHVADAAVEEAVRAALADKPIRALLAVVPRRLQHQIATRLSHPVQHDDVARALQPLQAAGPARIEHDRAFGI